MDIQAALGSDIMMALDLFAPYPSSDEKTREAVETTTRWAARAREHVRRVETAGRLWGITQGGVDAELRKRSTDELVELDFDGYAVGGLGIGEPKSQLFEMLELSDAVLPKDEIPLSDGDGLHSGHPGGRRARRGPLRLRASHAQRPERIALHEPRSDLDQEPEVRPRTSVPSTRIARAIPAAISPGPTSATSTSGRRSPRPS